MNVNATASTVIVVGNGFDLNLGLRTSYRDFLESKYFPETHDTASLAGHLRAQLALQNWVDVEVELANFSGRAARRPDLKSEYVQLRESLIGYISSIDATHIDRETHAYRMLVLHAVGDDFQIVNFNYTNTIDTVLRELGMEDVNFQDRVRSVHGTSKAGDIIFGVDDSAVVAQEHVFLFKSTASNFSARGITQLLLSAKHVVFFGHSLGHPDHMYFKDFFGRLVHDDRGQTIHFYHYTETGLLDLHKQLRVMSNSQVAKLKSNATISFHDVALPRVSY